MSGWIQERGLVRDLYKDPTDSETLKKIKCSNCGHELIDTRSVTDQPTIDEIARVTNWIIEMRKWALNQP